MNIKINEKFKSIIPPLSREEYEGLEQSIITEGCRDAICLWNDTIIDGHNRYNICNKHNLGYETYQLDFADENDVIIWIIKNQFNRRNINAYTRSVLALELEHIYKAKAKENKVLSGVLYGENHTKEEVCQNSDKPLETIFEEEKINKEPIEIKAIDTKKEIAKIADVSHDTIARVKEIEKKATPEIKTKLSTGEMSINQAYQDIKKEEKIEARKKEIEYRINNAKKDEDAGFLDIYNTNKKFRIIYADPPWSYNDKCADGSVQSGGVELMHYNVMSIKELCDMPISNITEKDAVLFLWVTSPLLAECFNVIRAWGFEYKSSFVWDKIKHNMGHYNSVRHEFLLICTKNSCVPDNKKLYDSVQSIEKTAHSKKPKEFIDIIDDLYKYGNRIELFCREQYNKDWFVWGNEI